MSRMWGPLVRLLSIVTPNTLWSLTSVICWLPTERCADGEWNSCRFWRVVRIMYFVFDGLRDTWLRCVYSATSERHDWRTVVIAGTSCPEVWIVVSSANMSHCAEGICKRRSFIWMENRRGPRTDPWGTPNKTVLKSDWLSFSETFWRLLLRKEQIKLRVFADRP